jgi:hypothetical protein
MPTVRRRCRRPAESKKGSVGVESVPREFEVEVLQWVEGRCHADLSVLVRDYERVRGCRGRSSVPYLSGSADESEV